MPDEDTTPARRVAQQMAQESVRSAIYRYAAHAMIRFPIRTSAWSLGTVALFLLKDDNADP